MATTNVEERASMSVRTTPPQLPAASSSGIVRAEKKEDQIVFQCPVRRPFIPSCNQRNLAVIAIGRDSYDDIIDALPSGTPTSVYEDILYSHRPKRTGVRRSLSLSNIPSYTQWSLSAIASGRDSYDDVIESLPNGTPASVYEDILYSHQPKRKWLFRMLLLLAMTLSLVSGIHAFAAIQNDIEPATFKIAAPTACSKALAIRTSASLVSTESACVALVPFEPASTMFVPITSVSIGTSPQEKHLIVKSPVASTDTPEDPVCGPNHCVCDLPPPRFSIVFIVSCFVMFGKQLFCLVLLILAMWFVLIQFQELIQACRSVTPTARHCQKQCPPSCHAIHEPRPSLVQQPRLGRPCCFGRPKRQMSTKIKSLGRIRTGSYNKKWKPSLNVIYEADQAVHRPCLAQERRLGRPCRFGRPKRQMCKKIKSLGRIRTGSYNKKWKPSLNVVYEADTVPAATVEASCKAVSITTVTPEDSVCGPKHFLCDLPPPRFSIVFIMGHTVAKERAFAWPPPQPPPEIEELALCSLVAAFRAVLGVGNLHEDRPPPRAASLGRVVPPGGIEFSRRGSSSAGATTTSKFRKCHSCVFAWLSPGYLRLRVVTGAFEPGVKAKLQFYINETLTLLVGTTLCPKG